MVHIDGTHAIYIGNVSHLYTVRDPHIDATKRTYTSTEKKVYISLFVSHLSIQKRFIPDYRIVYIFIFTYLTETYQISFVCFLLTVFLPTNKEFSLRLKIQNVSRHKKVLSSIIHKSTIKQSIITLSSTTVYFSF